jgi:DNA repair protein RadC
MSNTEEIHLIREVAIRYVGARRRAPGSITRPADVAAYLRRRVHDDAREHFVAIHLDGRHRPIGDQVISIGTATASLVHPREVFQAPANLFLHGVAAGSVAILLAHNHPSGDVTPSREDIEVTERLVRAGNLLGIPVLDHIVWSRDGGYHAIRESHPHVFSTV